MGIVLDATSAKIQIGADGAAVDVEIVRTAANKLGLGSGDSWDTDTIAWSAVNKTGSSLADLATKAYSALSNRPADDDFNTLTAETSVASDDVVAIYDTSATGYRKMTRSNFLSGIATVAGSDSQVQYNNGGSTLGGASNLIYDDTNNRVGIGCATPGVLLSIGTTGTMAGVMSLAGATSGVVTVQVAAEAGTWSLTLPATAGTDGYLLKTNGSGVTSWTNIAPKATVLETTRAIYGNNFDGSAALTQVIASTYGGTGNGFTKFTGPTTAEKTFTLPDASATILTSNAAVTVAQGGTGNTSIAAYSVICGGTTTTGAFQVVSGLGNAGQVLTSAGAGALPTWSAPTSTPAGSDTQIQYNNGSAMGGCASFYWDDANSRVGIGVASPSSALDIEGDVELASDHYYYIGDPTTNGSWRIGLDTGNFVIAKRETGSWVTKSVVS